MFSNRHLIFPKVGKPKIVSDPSGEISFPPVLPRGEGFAIDYLQRDNSFVSPGGNLANGWILDATSERDRATAIGRRR